MILGVYDDGDNLLSAVTKLRQKGVEILDCFTPYPVHNLDKAMGVERTNLTVGAFICGFTGFLSGLLIQFYMMTNHLGTFKSWPMIIGGKPMNFSMIPSMVPVFFEVTILFTAFGIGILFFYRAKMIHGKIAQIFDVRQTDDRLLVAIEPGQMNIDRSELDSILKENGAIEIRERNMEGGDQVVHHSSAPAAPADKEIVEKVKEVAEEAAETVELTEDEVSSRMNQIRSTLGEGNADNKDDLKKISGVGPKYEAQLNSLGIYSFEQISKLDSGTIQAIEELTKYFPGRIERDDWIGQARKLMND